MKSSMLGWGCGPQAGCHPSLLFPLPVLRLGIDGAVGFQPPNQSIRLHCTAQGIGHSTHPLFLAHTHAAPPLTNLLRIPCLRNADVLPSPHPLFCSWLRPRQNFGAERPACFGATLQEGGGGLNVTFSGASNGDHGNSDHCIWFNRGGLRFGKHHLAVA